MFYDKRDSGPSWARGVDFVVVLIIIAGMLWGILELTRVLIQATRIF